MAQSKTARDMDAIVEIVERVSALGMETCMTLGMVDREQSDRLGKAGLDYYNHNIDTSERYYPSVTSTRTFSDRLETLENVRQSIVEGVLRRHPRHGREQRPRRHAGHPGQPGGAAGKACRLTC